MKKESNLSLSKSIIIVMLSILVSRATGFLKEMLVPNTLGVGVIGDAYNVSIMIPEILFLDILSKNKIKMHHIDKGNLLY
ncbi:MAG TPA: hypothetical protein VFD03_03240 [Clostridia bacterium]|nr:hypothetical protein [Clostridia bacterium]